MIDLNLPVLVVITTQLRKYGGRGAGIKLNTNKEIKERGNRWEVGWGDMISCDVHTSKKGLD